MPYFLFLNKMATKKAYIKTLELSVSDDLFNEILKTDSDFISLSNGEASIRLKFYDPE